MSVSEMSGYKLQGRSCLTRGLFSPLHVDRPLANYQRKFPGSKGMEALKLHSCTYTLCYEHMEA